MSTSETSAGNRVDSKENVVSEGYTAGRLPQPPALEHYFQPHFVLYAIKQGPQISREVGEKIVQTCKTRHPRSWSLYNMYCRVGMQADLIVHELIGVTARATCK